MADVEIAHISKSYAAHPVIRDVSLKVADGEFIALVGASGCGKSTLLRMIAGLETITAGTLSIGGRVVNDVPSKDRDIAMVFQNYALYPHLTVAENMGFSLKLRGASKEQMTREIGQAAQVLGLSDYLDRYPRQLSGGQRQRVAMGRAIVRKPQVFLFDEPLSNLDAQLRVQMRVEVKTLQQRLGTTSIYVTHDQMEAMTMSDRIVILNAGRVEQIGAPLEVYDRPANLFVAAFIGSPAMNLLRGRLVDGPQGHGVDLGGLILPLPGRVSAEAGRAVVFGIRPERLVVSMAEDALSMTVDLVEATGAELHVHGHLGDHKLILAMPGRRLVRSGDLLPIAAEPADIHLFDAASGQRLDLQRESVRA
ncbi:ABC transporter ATP-binding protein [Lichenihabitans psoromatis]|uniref:ABC transporter ATP-binding protein n=1 Tax=Lichenihabitans psoromatis TaxID=2528642 RepID=UPI0010369B2D|nr:sn-glycerol-3-phosphate ABC transporter ATP-binding protein UgpC [Lichenihabitans psoromatis]